jgi:hypothetical protein
MTLLPGTLLVQGRRTVAAALRAKGLDQAPNWSCFHQVLTRARWSPCRAEMLWRHFRREVTHCELFQTVKALLTAVREFFDRYNRDPSCILSVIGSHAQDVLAIVAQFFSDNLGTEVAKGKGDIDRAEYLVRIREVHVVLNGLRQRIQLGSVDERASELSRAAMELIELASDWRDASALEQAEATQALVETLFYDPVEQHIVGSPFVKSTVMCSSQLRAMRHLRESGSTSRPPARARIPRPKE